MASLAGDWFPAAARGMVLELILADEQVGTGAGLLVAGGASIVVSWRLSFVVVGALALAVAWLLHGLPEPARGGASRLPAGQERILPASDTSDAAGGVVRTEDPSPLAPDDSDEALARSLVEQAWVKPDEDATLRGDSDRLPLGPC